MRNRNAATPLRSAVCHNVLYDVVHRLKDAATAQPTLKGQRLPSRPQQAARFDLSANLLISQLVALTRSEGFRVIPRDGGEPSCLGPGS
jgi:hypothetical protein